MSNPTETPLFDGLAFPVATVTYGVNGGYSATIKRDDDTYRARVGYDHAIGTGPRNAVRAAWKAYAKLQAEHPGIGDPSELVAVPASVDSTRYAFTFVPVEYFS